MSTDLAQLNLLEPQMHTVDGKEYILSKFPAVQGREIITKYPLSGLPKIGDYAVNEETMLKLMGHVAIKLPGGAVRLDNIQIINNHVPSWETLVKLEAKMLEYNVSFFQNGRILTFFEDFAQKAPQWISKILTDCLQRLSNPTSPPSTN